MKAPASGARPLNVLVFTTVFPSPQRPVHGLFVRERIRHLQRSAAIQVVAPVAWHARRIAGVAADAGGLRVHHPRFFYVPRLLKCLDGLFLFLSTVWCVRRIRRDFDFDVIDAHFAYPDGFAAALLGWYFERPLTITERGTLIPLSVYRLRARAADWALRRASRVIAVATALAERVAQAGVPIGRIAVIPNGIDVERFAPRDRATARARLGLPPGRLVVSVGHLSYRKGFHHVIAAVARLRRKGVEVSCAIVGGGGVEGNERPQLERLIETLDVGGAVRLVGPQAPDEVAWFLSAADVVVLASDYEGSPNVVLETMACGRPVVATRVGEVANMVPAIAGLVVDPPCSAETLAAALEDALGRRWNEADIRALAQRRTWDDVARLVLTEWCGATGRTPHVAASAAQAPLLVGVSE